MRHLSCNKSRAVLMAGGGHSQRHLLLQDTLLLACALPKPPPPPRVSDSAKENPTPILCPPHPPSSRPYNNSGYLGAVVMVTEVRRGGCGLVAIPANAGVMLSGEVWEALTSLLPAPRL